MEAPAPLGLPGNDLLDARMLQILSIVEEVRDQQAELINQRFLHILEDLRKGQEQVQRGLEEVLRVRVPAHETHFDCGASQPSDADRVSVHSPIQQDDMHKTPATRKTRASTFSLSGMLHPIEPVVATDCRANCINHRYLDTFANLMVWVQCFVTGAAVDQSIDGDPRWAVQALQHLCLVLYILEVLLRTRRGLALLSRRTWFWFDIAMITLGVTHLWLLRPLVSALGEDSDSTLATMERTCQAAMALRALRFERLAKVWSVKVLKLMHAIRSSIRTVFSAACLVAMGLYIFGCFAVEIFTKSTHFSDNPATEAIVDEYFPSLPVAMLSLLRLVTLDNAAPVYEPLVVREPWTALFFAVVILSLAISLLNIILADLVEKSMQATTTEIEHAKQRNKKREFDQATKALLSKMLPPHSDGSVMITESMIERHWHELRDSFLHDGMVSCKDFCGYFLVFDDERQVDQQAFRRALLELSLPSSPEMTKLSLKMEKLDTKLEKLWASAESGRESTGLHSRMRMHSPRHPSMDSLAVSPHHLTAVVSGAGTAVGDVGAHTQ